ncbi:3'-5' RNA helicase YTHDC2 isoform X1 [Danio rerio]|uniref:RNA helicase n=1 Tax=Danio rerio TaxID=7955 RepID=A0A8M9Q954_DANRE|nr:probable ATP-dependent RNA helicase YTHDC2 isoform X1 [Danio rerio]|eukprot:XP_021332046.1 probable ATP-dependent RNA helicase YTHDC2 isoform X1 [Danio rerio]
MSRGGQKSNMSSSKQHQASSLKAKGFRDIRIDEEVKIAVNIALERFQYSDEKELDFPSSLTNSERAFIHRLAQSLGYISKSRGKGCSRFLTVRKKDGMEAQRSSMSCSLSPSCRALVQSLMQRFPISSRERSQLQPHAERGLQSPPDTTDSKSRTSGRLSHGIPQVPPRRSSAPELDAFRKALPVYELQEQIIQSIRDHQVVLVLGETGSGKTTQIPQFLLDDCSATASPCRIFCTQPRRLATIAVAERVAAERGENIGQTVGYQIRLESRVSPKTLLTFCTSGVLLRTLMAGDEALSTVTHVIVDEVHERDGLTDFLLTKMKEVLQKMPNLRLVLSSAALDVSLFMRYFGSCPVIHIKGCPYEVKQLFLEDILRSTAYTNKDMIKYKKEAQKEESQQCSLSEWCERDVPQADPPERPTVCVLQDNQLLDDGGDSVFSQMSEKDVSSLEPWLLREMDSCISSIFLNQDADAFTQLFNLILNENISVDYRHSETSATALMVSAGRGFVSHTEQLLNMGANINIKASNGWTALDWAKHFKQTEAVDLLESHIWCAEASPQDEASLLQNSSCELSCEDQELLKAYHHSFDDEKVDLQLILHLLHSICQSSDQGAVLIFLPGYDEIVSLRDQILFDDKRFTEHQQRFQVFVLHSSMQTSDQKKVLKSTPKGVRKIILSTNIAETSITVSDVVFVIDSGKVKEKAYDALNNVTMLKMVWISKASALQRKGRAGRCRPGVCFHLFSRLRFSNMLEHQIPQLLRMPLQELCLHTKLLAPINCPVAEFLSRAPEPPHINTVKHAVQMLKTIDAMDPWENLTELGLHLADLPVEPHLGKMVLCAVVLKCLDPVLTIACTLAHREPFVLPAQAAQRRVAMLCRRRFTANTFSDHMALLRAFQAWQKARSDGWERAFCEKNFLSQATMEIIVSMRTQLLGQLRATGFVRARGGGDIRDVNQNSENWAVVKAALVAGMYPNLIHRDGLSLSGEKEKKVRLHPTSVLSQPQYKKIPPANGQAAAVDSLPTDWLIYDEMTRAHRIASVRCCTAVTPLTIALFGGGAKLPSSALQEAVLQRGSADSSDSEVEDQCSARQAHLTLDHWINFRLDPETAELVFGLRQRWQSVFLRRIRSPSKACSQLDESTIRTLVSVLSAEEQSAGLQQPTGIGQRPRPVSAEDSSSYTHTHGRSRNTADTPQQEATASPDRPRLASQLKNPRMHHSRHQEEDLAPCGISEGPTSPSTALVSMSACVRAPHSSVRYFIMKSSNPRNIELSQQRSVWSTTPNNEQKLNRAFQNSSAVFLVFSVQGSGHFQGYARMTSAVSSERCLDFGSSGLGGVFSVQWIHTESLAFQLTHKLLNPWNDNKKVQISRDAQELEPHTGNQLLQLWEKL